MRIKDELVEILREFKEKASAIGVKQFIIQTHFQTPLEVTPEAKEAIRKILSAGWIRQPLGNRLIGDIRHDSDRYLIHWELYVTILSL